MGSLLDLAPAPATVRVGTTEISVTGVSVGVIVALLWRFPELQRMMAKAEGEEINAADLMMLGGKATSAIIAAGCGEAGNPEYERVAGSIPAAAQSDLLAAILKLTMPDGIVPFAERLVGLAQTVGLTGSEPESPSASEPAQPQTQRAASANGHATEDSTPSYMLQ
jgi:hypothetical protein